MNWLWAYFRRKSRDAILAGINDALVAGGGTNLSDEQAAAAALGLIGPAAGPGSDGTPPPQPPQLQGSETQALGDSPKRGPGRPRKFQEPPNE